MSVDPDEVKAARADIDRRFRIAKRSILSTTTLVQEIVDEQSAGEYASPSTVVSLEQELTAVGDKFQDAHDAINALLVMDLLPGDAKAMEADLQTLVGLKRTFGGLARRATKKPPASPATPASNAPYVASAFRIQSSLKPKLLLLGDGQDVRG